jgi:hypothetical protein
VALEYLCAAPASFLVDVTGPRMMAMVGGALMSLGYISSGFVGSLKWYYLTLGILIPIGRAMTKNSVIAIIPHYFVKRLGLATGEYFFSFYDNNRKLNF